jgi:hypothetical protein
MNNSSAIIRWTNADGNIVIYTPLIGERVMLGYGTSIVAKIDLRPARTPKRHLWARNLQACKRR